MKHRAFIVIVSLLVGMWACETEDISQESKQDTCVKVKIVASICGNAVLQIQDPAYYSYGEKGWASGGQVLDHVFYTEFSCQDERTLSQLGSSSLVGTVLNVKFVEKPTAGECIRCMATVANAPNTRRYVQISTDCNETTK